MCSGAAACYCDDIVLVFDEAALVTRTLSLVHILLSWLLVRCVALSSHIAALLVLLPRVLFMLLLAASIIIFTV